MPKNHGGRPIEITSSKAEPVNSPTLADIGVTKKTSMRAQQLAAMPAERFAMLIQSSIYSASGVTHQILLIFRGGGWMRPSCTQRRRVLLCGTCENMTTAHSCRVMYRGCTVDLGAETGALGLGSVTRFSGPMRTSSGPSCGGSGVTAGLFPAF